MIAVWNPLLSSTFTVAISDATRGGATSPHVPTAKVPRIRSSSR